MYHSCDWCWHWGKLCTCGAMGSMGKLYFQFCYKPKTTLKTVAKKQKTVTDPAMFLCPKNSPSKNTGVDSQSHLQGIFPTQESNLGLPHFRQSLPSEPPVKGYTISQSLLLHAGFLQLLWAHGLSYSTASRIFLDQGSNPGPLHWQADSYLLYHQGSPEGYIVSYIQSNANGFSEKNNLSQ